MNNASSDQIKNGVFWNFCGHFAGRFLAFGTNIVMARMLMPQDFGKVAVAMVVWEIITLFGAMGLSSKLIHQQDDIARYATAAFWMNIFIAVSLAAAALAVSPLAAAFYETDLIKPFITVLALGHVITSLGNIHTTLMLKKMAFKRLSILNMGVSVMESLTAILMVLNGYGVWSLMLPKLLSAPIRVTGLWLLEPWRPQMRLYLQHWKDIFTFGKYVFGTTLLRYININCDYIVIGKTLGTGALGFYQHAYSLANWPIQNIVWVAVRVMFPAFAGMQKNRKEFQRLYLKTVANLAIIAFPCLTGLIIVADDLIPVVYSAKWIPSILPLKLILAFAFVRCIGSIGGQVLLAVGQPNREFRFNAMQALPLIASILIGSKFGINGVAAGMSLVLSIFGIVFIQVASGAIGLNISHVGRAVYPAALCSGIMWGLLAVLEIILHTQEVNQVVSLLLTMACGMVIYTAAMLGIFRMQARDFLNLANDVLIQRFGFLKARRKPQMSG